MTPLGDPQRRNHPPKREGGFAAGGAEFPIKRFEQEMGLPLLMEVHFHARLFERARHGQRIL